MSPSFPVPSEPEFRPEQPDSPVINTRQEIISRKRGVLHRTSRDAGVDEGKVSAAESPYFPVQIC